MNHIKTEITSKDDGIITIKTETSCIFMFAGGVSWIYFTSVTGGKLDGKTVVISFKGSERPSEGGIINQHTTMIQKVYDAYRRQEGEENAV